MWILGLKGLNTMFQNFDSAGDQKGHILASSKLVTLFILLQLIVVDKAPVTPFFCGGILLTCGGIN